jgi:phosphoribosyl 1,2-cyclic phosphodiesterase
MVEVCSLSSGSKGNSYFIRTGDKKILVDVGISGKRIIEKLSEIGYSILDIDYIFITHEHSDHVKGLKTLIKKYDIPVFITKKTYDMLNLDLKPEYLKYIRKNSELYLDKTIVQIIEKPHDAVDPVFFNFLYMDKKVSIITDLGSVTESVIDSVKNSDILFLETNYDKNMLYNGQYERFLKKRIDGRLGHLSNCDAASIIEKYATKSLKYLFLSHISEKNNDFSLIKNLFNSIPEKRKDLKNMEINITFQRDVSKIVKIS